GGEQVSETVTLDRIDEHIAHVRLNRPDVMNVLNSQLIDDLYACFRECGGDEHLRVIVLSGAGKAFCAGGDVSFLNEISKMSADEVESFLNELSFKLGQVGRVRKPVIGALHGYVLGAGFALSLLCDIRMAAEKTQFGAEFPKMGLVPELGITYTLPALVGLAKALELSLTARRFDASEALSMGLVSRVVEESELIEEATTMARYLAELPPLALGLTKHVVRKGAESSFEESVRLETQFNRLCYTSQDHREAASAFFEKRKPVFSGR
ncbi:MAG: enoyl-CoA hydratase-related protein, partial [Deltaproteobacteria bacterium]